MGEVNNLLDPNLVISQGPPTWSTVNALKIALNTMKERCQKLQNRLTSMEEENLQLRIERHSIPGLYKKEPDANPDLSLLNRKVEKLLRHKSKLSHHIFMVASENADLWGKLSKLSEDKNHMDVDSVSHSIERKTSSGLKPLRSLHVMELCKGNKEESLEEISLKGINGIKENHIMEHDSLAEKTSTDILKVSNCEFTLSDMSEEEVEEYEADDIIQKELIEVLGRLKREKYLLRKQQEDLKVAFEYLNNFTTVSPPCKSCLERLDVEANTKPVLDSLEQDISCSESDEKNKSEGEVLKISNGIPLKHKENNFEDRICPLCAKFFDKSTPFDAFNDHVLSHFVEESEQDSHMSIYEVTA